MRDSVVGGFVGHTASALLGLQLEGMIGGK
jgi:hypothetical protein